MRKGVIVITFLLACNVAQAQQPFRRSFLFTEKDSTMHYSSVVFFKGKLLNRATDLQSTSPSTLTSLYNTIP
ncbi:hypothetical protein LBMAG25_11550 [Bacteroidota bacterium]|nr:hypothetical protein LBMAG25_11550 [Bacteroidota bacterium]